MKTIALIPARGGSKGVPRKNIKRIFGKPLICWSIEQALEAIKVSDVFVSTNCPDIAKVSSDAGANIPFLRPDNLSGGKATTESVVLHFCEFLTKKRIDVDNILLIQCTSPVRAKGRFDEAIEYFEKGNYDSLLSVTKSHRFLWKNKKLPEPSYDIYNRPRRQDILEGDCAYIETGSFYLFKKNDFLREKNRIFGNIALYNTPENEMIDIDTITDFSICESLLKVTKKGLVSAQKQ